MECLILILLFAILSLSNKVHVTYTPEQFVAIQKEQRETTRQVKLKVGRFFIQFFGVSLVLVFIVLTLFFTFVLPGSCEGRLLPGLSAMSVSRIVTATGGRPMTEKWSDDCTNEAIKAYREEIK